MTIILILIICISLLVISACLSIIIFGYNSKNWMFTKGHVIESHINEIESVRKFPSMYDEPYLKTYYLSLSYEYYVKEKRYNSKLISFDDIFSNNIADKNIIDDSVNKFAKNTEVTVYYNKNFPFISVLKTGIKQIGAYIFIITICTIVLAFSLIFI